MRIGKAGILISVVVIIFGGIAVSNALGLWVTESKKEPVKILAGEFKGYADPNDIRGSYTFADLEKNFGVTVASLAEAFGIDGTEEEKASYKCNGLEEKYAGLSQEIGTDSVRLFVGLATGLPVEKGAYIPDRAVAWLFENASLSDDDRQYLETHTLYIEQELKAAAANKVAATEKAVSASPVKATEAKIAAAPESAPQQKAQEESAEPVEMPEDASKEEEIEITEKVNEEIAPVQVQDQQTEEHEQKKEDRTVKGSTTIWDIMQWGVARQEIGPAIGIDLPADNGAKIRDLMIAAGKSFDDAKVILQEMVDKAAGK